METGHDTPVTLMSKKNPWFSSCTNVLTNGGIPAQFKDSETYR